MINLRHLEIDGCQSLAYMPCRLGELTMLQTLPLFVIGKGDREGISRLNELQCLNNLRGGLEIRNLQRVKGGALESKEANLKEKHYLQSLALEWRWWERGKITRMERMRLHLTHLHALEYVLENSSSAEPFFPSLKTLKLDSLESLQLPSCPSLSELKIYECDQLTTFQLLSSPLLSLMQKLGIPATAFVSFSFSIMDCTCDQLTTLKLISSPHLSKLFIGDGSCLESLQLPSLPCLEELWLGRVREEILWQIILVSSSLKSLHIWGINDLVSLPDDRLQHLTSLKSLQIKDCDGQMSLFQGIQHLSALEKLEIAKCGQLNLSDTEAYDGGLQFQGLRSLRQLFIKGIPALVSLPKGLQHVTTLETLSIRECSYFITLPDWISSLTSLSKLEIGGCPRFKLGDRSKIAHIPTVDIQLTYVSGNLTELEYMKESSSAMPFFPSFKGLQIFELLNWKEELLWPTMFCLFSLQMLDICGRGGLISQPEEGL
ncbi:Disease resistance protein RGA2 [Vitis vinifera]|uniref:Disease resistance protein RGA2 n=1 Tax=Vitis vinifera TaxID=29760 RepID=A0A438CBX5_VITVI|nr:Disease resistance protein RGA2 [Vitis vinifera]